jgi:serine/threonine-protein kinase
MYQINHPNVVRVFTYYLYEEYYTGYILMEYIDGEPIDKWFDLYFLQRTDSNKIFRQLVEGFACIEKIGIVHRDIRESNILISNKGEVKIIDFGLGKKVDKPGMSVDSFNKIINRQQMQRIPNEFSEGKYTSKTDMFCVAELFLRMVKKYNISDFKHEYILNKMMNLDPDKRYDSFKEILAALDKKDMKALEISENDKITYREFTESIYGVLAEFSETPNIEQSVSNVLEGLQRLLESNCLNETVQNVTELIGVFVKSGYRYYNTRYVDVEAIYIFYNWFISKDEAFQNVILKNIKNRLLSRPVKVGEELPF